MREVSVSSIMIFPELGVSRSPSWFKRVVFPEPLGPIIATNSPRRIFTFTPLRALTCASPILKVRTISIPSIIVSSAFPVDVVISLPGSVVFVTILGSSLVSLFSSFFFSLLISFFIPFSIVSPPHLPQIRSRRSF
ncbi:hypothetical protein SDC9_183461 [bioreactor metagenome]|uniref:Uncharacterized protein n=1 Tax=bioreactor metagenome TaxID=1076179 RepID=A0A645HBQ9_9ZZZZ